MCGVSVRQILLVEDEEPASKLIKQYVEQFCVDCQCASFPSAAQALAWARTYRADLFILDIQLPDYRGTELARQIRAMPDYRFTPILFTTELAGEELSAYREIKCYDFLVKPFTEEQFRTAVTSALELGQRMETRPIVLRVEQRQFLFEYDLQNILYIESFGKRAVIHSVAAGRILADQVSGYSLARFLELAGPGRLIQCHKSYLINPVRLEKMDKQRRLLWLRDCPDPIPIGEKYQGNLREVL